MSQSRTTCPHCGREPGGIHAETCPRSQTRMREMDSALERAGRPKLLWTKGPQIVIATGERVVNPGIPYVNPDNGKPWFAGGVPASMRRS